MRDHFKSYHLTVENLRNRCSKWFLISLHCFSRVPLLNPVHVLHAGHCRFVVLGTQDSGQCSSLLLSYHMLPQPDSLERTWAGAGEEGVKAETLPCQPLLVTALSDSVKDQAHYKETFFSYGKM